MGNCQAIDAATAVIQHPSGRVEKLYWPVAASELMKANPGYYVAVLLSTTLYPPNMAPVAAPADSVTTSSGSSVRLTRIKLLRPTDTIALGHVYRLITSQEVMKVMWAKKQAKMKQNQTDQINNSDARNSDNEKPNLVGKSERQRKRSTTPINCGTSRPRTWQPSLNSISEASN